MIKRDGTWMKFRLIQVILRQIVEFVNRSFEIYEIEVINTIEKRAVFFLLFLPF